MTPAAVTTESDDEEECEDEEETGPIEASLPEVSETGSCRI